LILFVVFLLVVRVLAVPAPDEQAIRAAQEKWQKKMQGIVIPKIELPDATLAEAVDFLNKEARRLDPAGTGVPIKLRLKPNAGPAAVLGDSPQIPGLGPSSSAISLANIPLSEALRYVTALAGTKCAFEPDGVVIVAETEPDPIFTRSLPLPPAFFSWLEEDDRRNTTDQAAQARRNFQGYLAAKGVGLSIGSSAALNPAATELALRVTDDQFEQIAKFIDEQQYLAVPGPEVPKIRKITEPGDGMLVTWEFFVPPDPIAAEVLGLTKPKEARSQAPEWLVPQGKQYHPEVSAVYVPQQRRLVVRNAIAHLERVQARVEEAWKIYYEKNPPEKSAKGK
jgi:hypothetical protein